MILVPVSSPTVAMRAAPLPAAKPSQSLARRHLVFVLRFVGTFLNQADLMDPVDVFSVRDLRQRSGELLRDAENGHVALITKHGRPAILAVPFDARLLDLGVHRALALHLFENRLLSLTQAAKLAAIAVEEFVELLGRTGVPAVDYPPEELHDEISAAS